MKLFFYLFNPTFRFFLTYIKEKLYAKITYCLKKQNNSDVYRDLFVMRYSIFLNRYLLLFALIWNTIDIVKTNYMC